MTAPRTGLAAAVAADGLPGSRLRLPQEPLPEGRWSLLLSSASTQRISGFLVQAIENGRFAATDEQYEGAWKAQVEAMSVAVRLERTLLTIGAVLETAGIPFRVLKGPAIAHLVYTNPVLRSFNDIDVLVCSPDIDRTIEVLGDAGFRRVHQRLSPEYDARFGKGMTLRGPEKLEVDLHRTFVGGRYGLNVRLDDLFATSSEFHIGGRRMLGLGPEERFLHACYHAAVGDPVPRLVSLRDIAEMVLRRPLDVERARALCSDWGGLPIMARAIRATWDTFELADLNALSVWAERYRPTRSETRALTAYTTQRSAGGQAVTSLSAIPTLRAKASFFRSVAFPEKAFRETKSNRGLRTWWLRGVRSALRLRQGRKK